MSALKRYCLPLAILLAIGVYWLVFPLMPRPSGSNAVSVLSICAGIFLFIQYVEASYHILFRNERRTGWIAVLSATTAALGVVVSGAYLLLWLNMGQPDNWVGSSYSSFGRALLAVGFFGLGISHEITKIGDGYSKGLWRAALIVLSIVVAFLAGTYFASP